MNREIVRTELAYALNSIQYAYENTKFDADDKNLQTIRYIEDSIAHLERAKQEVQS